MNARSSNAGQRESLGSAVTVPIELRPPGWNQWGGTGAMICAAPLCAYYAHQLYGSGWLTWAVAFAAGALICAVGGTWRLVQRRRMFATLQLFDNGVAVTRGARTAALPFRGLRQVTVRHREVLLHQTLRWHRRKLVFESQLGSRISRFVVHAKTDARQGDPLGVWVEQMLRYAAAAFRTEGTGFRSLEGRGWRLDDRGLRLARSAPTPLAQLVSLSLLDRTLRVWRAGEERPCLQVPTSSRNARLLARILEDELRSRSATDAEAEPQMGLEFSIRHPNRLLGVVVALLGVGAGAALLLRPDALGISEISRWGLLLVSSWAVYRGLVWITETFAFHDEGVRVSDLLRRRDQRFDEFVSMRYLEQSRYLTLWYAPIFIGVLYRLVAVPQRGPRLRLSMLLRNTTPPDVRAVRDVMALHVAAKMLERVEAGLAVRWGAGRLDGEGFHFRPRWYRRRVTIPLDRIRVRIVFDKCRIYDQQDVTCDLAVRPTDWNYFPGSVLSRRLGLQL